MKQETMNKNNLNDSDIEIIDNNVTVVSISESELDESLIKSQSVVELLDDESEEGELVEDKHDDTNLVFEINFPNKDYFQSNASIIAETLEKAFANTKSPINCNLSNLDLRITAYTINNDRLKSVSKESSPDLTGIKELFTIDPSPSEIREIVQVPSYKRSIKNVLDEESTESKRKKVEDSMQRARPAAACFNCGVTGHALRDCPKKRNGRRIQKARNKFMTTSEKRYHSNIENKYPDLRPGVISEKLRRALGYRTGEIPFFFYRMRTLGYPPGWLEEAKVQASGLALISADGNKLSLEEGVNSETQVQSDKFDVGKLIDFPGFNALPKQKFYDDYKHHNVPPMQPSFMKEEFIKQLGDNVVKSYKRKKISNIPQTTADEIPCAEPTDMEIENENEEEIVETIIKSTEEETVEDNESINIIREDSPSLADLQAQQLAIVEALETGIASRRNSESEDNLGTPKSAPATPLIKESHMGTPLLKFSPFEKLPCGDNFKVGVSDVINFENLPDSTGKYEQMKLVIKKVRNIVTQLNNDTTD